MQNLFSFQTSFKFSKFIDWLWRYNIWRKRPFSTLLSKKNKQKMGKDCLVMIYYQGNYRLVGGPEASDVAAMMFTGMRSFFQSRVQKNLKSLYQSFVPQTFASAHVCANRCNRKQQVFSSKYPNQVGLCGKPLHVSQEPREEQHRFPGREPLSSTLNTLFNQGTTWGTWKIK